MEKVVAKGNMTQALQGVEENREAPGIDGMPVKALRRYLVANWLLIKEQLLAGTYQPQLMRQVEIPKI